MITEDYCSFEVAKLLKEKGFNELCFRLIRDYGEIIEAHSQAWNGLTKKQKADFYLCPTHQMALKWLREEKNVYIEIRRSVNTFLFGAIIRKFVEDNFYQIPRDLESYEEAVEAALKYSLENLI